MPPPQPQATHILRQTTHLIERGRPKPAATSLLSLPPKFLTHLATGTDLPSLTQAATLFQALIAASYHRCRHRAVDLAVNRLLIKTVKGCENRLVRVTKPPAHQGYMYGLRWMSQSEIETREVVDVCRGFLGYVGAQDAEFCQLQDPLVFGARRILQRVAPRIGCAGVWEGRRGGRGGEWIDVPRREGRGRGVVARGRRMGRRREVVVEEVVDGGEVAVEEEEDGSLSLEESLESMHVVGVTVPTVVCTPRLRLADDGMVEEETQPFTPSMPPTAGEVVDEWGPDVQLKREWMVWKEREEKPFVMMTPDMTGMVR